MINYNPVLYIWKFHEVLIQVPFTTSKKELDIWQKKLNVPHELHIELIPSILRNYEIQ